MGIASTRWTAVLAVGVTAALPFRAAMAEPITAVPTFESIGLYWKGPPPAGADGARVQYRASGISLWRDGLPLWYDARNGEYRGSLVQLSPNRSYDVRVTATDGTRETVTTRTWAETFPVAKTIKLPASSTQALHITEGGTPSGYVVYAGPSRKRKASIDVHKQADYDVVISASYVILRNVNLKGARHHGILVGTVGNTPANVHDVVIEDSDVSAWGSISPKDPRWGNNRDSAIYSGSSDLVRVVIQRNRFHNPSYDTNSWEEVNDGGKHPKGPQPITLLNTQGQLVIRYNEIYTDPDHYFQDGMGGVNNFSDVGFPNRDSDIYGNWITGCWDDAIEVEGGDRNVRVWGNYTDHILVPIAVAAVHGGPLYAWRNVSNVSSSGPGNTQSVSFFKMRNLDDTGKNWGGGRMYIFNNTALQPGGSGGTGVHNFLKEYEDSDPILNVRTLNNVMTVDRANQGYSIKVTSPGSAMDYDLLEGRVDTTPGQEGHGVPAAPILADGDGLDARKHGTFSLEPGTPGYDAGQVIPNFVTTYTGRAPDMGAMEAGTAPMEFGVDAYRN